MPMLGRRLDAHFERVEASSPQHLQMETPRMEDTMNFCRPCGVERWAGGCVDTVALGFGWQNKGL